MARQRTRFQGVYKRTSSTKRHDGKPDVCYDITYKIGSRKVWEKVGWLSEGYTEAMAATIRGEKIQDSRHQGSAALADRPAPTFGLAWQRYETDVVSRQANPKPDRNRHQRHLAPLLEDVPLDLIDKPLLRKLQKRAEDKGLAQQTVKHVLAQARRTIEHAIAEGLWSGPNPVRLGTKGRRNAPGRRNILYLEPVNNNRERFLTPAEATALMAELKRRSVQTWAYSLLSLHSGLRAGEVFTLTGDSVQLANGLLRIRDPKTGVSRWAHLTSTAADALRAQGLKPGRPVFTSRNGGPIDAPSEAFNRATEALGLNPPGTPRLARVVFHTLRHTFGSWLTMSGVPLQWIAELMGHSDVETTRRYAHLAPGVRQGAMSVIEDVFNGHQPSSPAELPGTVARLFAGIE